MKSIFAVIICLFVLTSFTKAQNWKPDPIKNSTMEMLMGTWKSEPYKFFGNTCSDVVTHTMEHNGQYMYIDVKEKDDRGQTYTATIIITCDKDGNVTGWGFDDYGKSSSITGKASGNHVSVTSVTPMGTEIRDIDINGNDMTHTVNLTFKMENGKEIKEKTTITYHKQ